MASRELEQGGGVLEYGAYIPEGCMARLLQSETKKMMRRDLRGNPDICRVVCTPVAEATRELIERFKLDMNTTINNLIVIHDANRDPVVKRLLAMAVSEFEVGAELAAKAMTYETFMLPKPPFEGQTG